MATPGKPDRVAGEPALGGTTTVVETACPLDCPDACSLAVTVKAGKVVTIDGSRKNPVTDGYICAKVRRFGDRVYGPDRLLYPAIRKGRRSEEHTSELQSHDDMSYAVFCLRSEEHTSEL